MGVYFRREISSWKVKTKVQWVHLIWSLKLCCAVPHLPYFNFTMITFLSAVLTSF